MKKKSTKKTKATSQSAPIEAVADLKQARRLVLDLLAIPGKSTQEGPVVEFITRRLCEAGAPYDAIRTDRAHRRSLHPGEIGNLIFKLPGTVRGPRRLLMAHMDTVPLCVGSKPVVRDGIVSPADSQTALGADDRAGAAVVLATAIELLKSGRPHPPLTFFWTVQEELGLHGARNATLGMLGKPKLAFNYDGGSSEKLTVGATGGYRMNIHIDGIASHAGGAPEKGVSAITIASLAIAQLHQDGWLGQIEQGNRAGTSNIGTVDAGQATNVVAPNAVLRAEARSHTPAFRQKIVRAIERAFEKAVRSVRNVAGKRGKVRFDGRLDYEAFKLADDEPCVLAAEAAVRAAGGDPIRSVCNGGLDANWMTARGIPTVTLGCGQLNPHTIEERLVLAEFDRGCNIALRLATGC